MAYPSGLLWESGSGIEHGDVGVVWLGVSISTMSPLKATGLVCSNKT
jgi:hypothetical protein